MIQTSAGRQLLRTRGSRGTMRQSPPSRPSRGGKRRRRPRTYRTRCPQRRRGTCRRSTSPTSRWAARRPSPPALRRISALLPRRSSRWSSPRRRHPQSSSPILHLHSWPTKWYLLWMLERMQQRELWSSLRLAVMARKKLLPADDFWLMGRQPWRMRTLSLMKPPSPSKCLRTMKTRRGTTMLSRRRRRKMAWRKTRSGLRAKRPSKMRSATSGLKQAQKRTRRIPTPRRPLRGRMPLPLLLLSPMAVATTMRRRMPLMVSRSWSWSCRRGPPPPLHS
mmetsp:Transcript_38025/g.107411  ORF Transcript_38025/g.107411 Transcript_38025/m.107411 type:complete len:278 (-) Transcript_38025:550-1383(-)